MPSSYSPLNPQRHPAGTRCLVGQIACTPDLQDLSEVTILEWSPMEHVRWRRLDGTSEWMHRRRVERTQVFDILPSTEGSDD